MLKRTVMLFAVIGSIVVSILGFKNFIFSSTEQGRGDGIVQSCGRLQVKNAHVCAEDGTPVSLGGMSFFWSGWASKYYNTKTVDYLVDKFKVSVVRAAYGVPEGSGPQGDVQDVKNIIEAAIARDIYVIIDWHGEGNLIPYKDQAKKFYSDMIRDYGKNDHVIYELWNEPTNQSDDDIKSYCQELTNYIRSEEKKNNQSPKLIINGSRIWSQYPNSYKIDDPGNNAAYTFHGYFDNQPSHLSQLTNNCKAAMDMGNAVFVTEYGASYDKHSGTEQAIKWCQDNNISMTAWSVNDKSEDWSIFTNNMDDLTAIGNYYKEKISSWKLAKIGNLPTQSTSDKPTTSNPTSVPTVSPTKDGNEKLVWSDEFNGNSLDTSKWGYEIGGNGWGNNELEYYTDSNNNCSVSGGTLNITARKESINGKNYSSARIKTQNKVDWRYGKVEAKIKMPSSKGLWPAFWMLGSNISSIQWPGCGEIDIMEHVNTDPNIVGTIHWDNNGYKNYGKSIGCDVSNFHVYAIEWNSTSIKWFVDGKQYCESNIAKNINGTEEFHKPFFIILNMAVGGNWPGNPDESTSFPAEMKIDYVRVYNTNPDNTIVKVPSTPKKDLDNVKAIKLAENKITTNTLDNLPKTGENSNLSIITFGLILLLSGLGYLTYKRINDVK